MKKISILTIALVAGMSLNASARITQYVAPRISIADTNYKDNDGAKKSETNGFLSVAYGIKPTSWLRTEIEIGVMSDYEEEIYYSGRNEKYTLSASSVMLNTYFDINTHSKWNPYFTFGVGNATLTHKYETEVYGSPYLNEDIKSEDTNFAWNAGVGVAFDMNKRVSFDFGYKYSDLGDVKIKYSDEKISETVGLFSFGARLKF